MAFGRSLLRPANSSSEPVKTTIRSIRQKAAITSYCFAHLQPKEGTLAISATYGRTPMSRAISPDFVKSSQFSNSDSTVSCILHKLWHRSTPPARSEFSWQRTTLSKFTPESRSIQQKLQPLDCSRALLWSCLGSMVITSILSRTNPTRTRLVC